MPRGPEPAPSRTATGVPDAPGRLAWLDVAKGACIVLVVLHHVVTKQLGQVVPTELGWVEQGWGELTLGLKPLRMPLFFVISGYFVAGGIQRPWRSVARRVTGPYYLYVVWLLAYVVVYRFETTAVANRTDDVGDLAGQLLLAETSMWFLYALAVYFVLAKLLRRLPAGLVVLAAAALAVASGWSGIEEYNKVSVLAHFGFFAFGAYFPDLVRRAGELGGRALLRLLLAYVALVVVIPMTGVPWSVTLVSGSVAGVPLGLGLMARAAAVPRVATGLAWLGRRTLRVYVLHFAVVAASLHLPLALSGTGPDGALLAVLLPVVLCAAVIGACLAAHEVLVACGGRFLFRLPRWLESLQQPRARLEHVTVSG